MARADRERGRRLATRPARLDRPWAWCRVVRHEPAKKLPEGILDDYLHVRFRLSLPVGVQVESWPNWELPRTLSFRCGVHSSEHRTDSDLWHLVRLSGLGAGSLLLRAYRSEERRVGKECG